MKFKFKIAIAFFVLLCFNSRGQENKSGVYLTKDDFKSQKLTCESGCTSDKIRLNRFFGKNNITVFHDGKKYEFLKSEIYGYRECNNKVFRFYQGSEYEIVENAGIVIYTKERAVPKGKSFVILHQYYFSKTTDGELIPLSVGNLKIAYPEHHKFHLLLDLYFCNDHKVSEYDDFYKTYKVNYIFETSTKYNF